MCSRMRAASNEGQSCKKLQGTAVGWTHVGTHVASSRVELAPQPLAALAYERPELSATLLHALAQLLQLPDVEREASSRANGH